MRNGQLVGYNAQSSSSHIHVYLSGEIPGLALHNHSNKNSSILPLGKGVYFLKILVQFPVLKQVNIRLLPCPHSQMYLFPVHLILFLVVFYMC